MATALDQGLPTAVAEVTLETRYDPFRLPYLSLLELGSCPLPRSPLPIQMKITKGRIISKEGIQMSRNILP
jgi:hypothetical protein